MLSVVCTLPDFFSGCGELSKSDMRATSSGSRYGTSPGNVIDGEYSAYFWTPEDFYQSPDNEAHLPHWLQVELAEETDVEQVVVKFRADCCQEGNRHVQVSIGLSVLNISKFAPFQR